MILLFASCQKESDINLSTYDGRLNFEEKLKSDFVQNLKSKNEEFAISILMEDLHNQSTINDISIDQDSISIFWTFEEKIRCCFYIGPKDSSIYTNTSSSVDISENLQRPKSDSKGRTLDNAIILSPINWYLDRFLGTYDETELISEKLKSIGFIVNYKRNSSKDLEEISFDDYERLNSYGVVYLKTHGTIDPKSQNFCLYSGVIITEARDQQYAGLLRQNILIHFIDPNGNSTYGLTTTWLKSSLSPAQNVLFFVSACQSNQNSTLRSLVVGRGSTFFGWDKPVTLRMSYNTGIAIFNKLIDNKLNVYESWLAALKDGYCIDKDNNYTSTLNLEGDHELRLLYTIPTVITLDATNITSFFANVGGNVVSNGGMDIIERGIYYGLFHDPEETGTRRSIGLCSGIGDCYFGEFKTSITRLQPNSVYYFKAYAKNLIGTAFGKEFFLKTSPNIETPPVMDIDNNVYSTVKIGSQTWMAENLKTTRYSDGTEINNLNDSLSWISPNLYWHGGYCGNPNIDSFVSTYGLLYNFYAVADAHGLCPIGWHVPTDEDWTILTNYLGGVNVAGAKMKEVNETWFVGNIFDAFYTNESGFSALPAGARYSDGTFSGGIGAYFWSSSEVGYDTWIRFLQLNEMKIVPWTRQHRNGFSVRCIKDK